MFLVRLCICLFILFGSATPGRSFAEISGAFEAPYIYHSVNVMTGCYVESATDLTLGGTQPLALRRCYQSQKVSSESSPSGWFFNLPSLCVSNGKEVNTSGDSLSHCAYDEEGRVTKVKALQSEEREIYRQVNFTYEIDEDSCLCTAVADDQTVLVYRYFVDNSSYGNPSLYLSSVEKNGEPLVAYEYAKHPSTRSWLLIKRAEVGGQYLAVEYYDSLKNDVGGTLIELEGSADFRWGRVKLLKAPAGPGGEPVITHRFFYGEDFTEVRDALDHKVVYRYSDIHRLTAVEYYDENEELYRAERFTWKTDFFLEQPLMTSRILEDDNGVVVTKRTFEYDAKGCLIKETLHGDLSGKGGGKEKKSISYSYEEGLLTEKKEGNSLKTSYTYDEKKRLAVEHQIIDGMFHIRTFHTYDADGLEVERTVDNGSGDRQTDIVDVTQRRTIATLFSKEACSFGLPLVVEELYWDPEVQELVSLGQVIGEYSSKGDLVRQQTVDTAGVCIKETVFSYDRLGRVVIESERGGDVVSIEYDPAGNVIGRVAQKPDGKFQAERFAYDPYGRLVWREESNESCEPVVSRFSYNAAGLKVAESCDGKGIVSYSYDAMGRVVEVRNPAQLIGEGIWHEPVTTYRYDVCDNIIAVTDPNGWTTEMKFTVRNKPSKITHPDGTAQLFRYDPAGMLVKEVQQDGVEVHYSHDGLGRCTRRHVVGADGKEISAAISVYDSFQLVAEADSTSGKKRYRYDPAGRLRECLQQDGPLFEQTLYTYDNQGRLLEKKVLVQGGYETEILTYGEKGVVEAVEVRNKEGITVYRESVGEKENAVRHRRNGFEQDPLGRLAAYAEETDAFGNVVKTTFDMMGRPVEVVKKDSFNTPLFHVEYRYDPTGNKVEEIYHDLEGGPSLIYSWQYGIGNRLEACVEGRGGEEQRSTSYYYNSQGVLDKVVKPDGIVLRYKYDPAGRLEEVCSSDQTVHNRYRYDKRGNVASISDLLTGAEAERSYGPFNKLEVDKQSNGLQMIFEYGLNGLLRSTRFPDGSSTVYEYAGRELKEVRRLDRQGDEVYAHTYVQYENGRPTLSSLIGGVGLLQQKYGDDGRKISSESPYWSEYLLHDEKSFLLERRVKDSAGSYIDAYAYNERGQLASEKGTNEEQHLYDSFGNHLEADMGGGCKPRSSHGVFYEYDRNGNLTKQEREGVSKTFRYDALNRLIAVVEEEKLLTEYTYDGFNRRMLKKASSWNSSKGQWEEQAIEYYLYDGEREIGAADSGGIRQLRILGLGNGAELGAAVAIELEGDVFAPLHDSRGNIVALVSAGSGEVVESYRYTAFGICTVYDGEGFCTEDSEIGMPWGFSSKRRDLETGWIFFGRRHYDPALKRWTTPDPLGIIDGPNRYAYVRNNPMMNRDLYGEFSIGEVWHSAVKMLKQGAELLGNAIRAYQEKVGYSHYSRHEIEEFANHLLGTFFLRMTGYYVHNAEAGVFGCGEINDKVRVTMINGILNIRADYLQTVKSFSEAHGGVNIHYIFRPTDGWAHDLLQCVLAKAGVVSSQSQLLARTWKKMIHEMGGIGGGGVIVHYAHSIGGTETRNAKKLLTPEERAMIKVITFGSATLIPDTDFQSASNYVSWRDGVCYFDPISYLHALLNHDTNIYLIGNMRGFPLIDHFLEGRTYADVALFLGGEFVRVYGSLLEK